MQSANASIPSQYRFFPYVEFDAPVQRLPSLLEEKLTLFLWPKIVGILAFKCLARPTEQVLTYAIQPYEPQRLTLLDEQHERNVFEDCVEECVGSFEFFLDALALADVRVGADPAYHITGAISVRRIDGLSAFELTPDGQFVFVLNPLSTQDPLDVGTNDLECRLAHHLHNRPADDLFQGQPDPFGVGGVRR